MSRHVFDHTMSTGAFQQVQEFLASKISTVISYMAAGVGLASFMGWASFGATLLSIAWLVTQLFNYITFTYPNNLRERRRMELEEIEEERAKEVRSGNSLR